MSGRTRLMRWASAQARRFRASRSGVAAIEFALVFPIALVLYIGSAEIADGVMTSRKVTTVTRTLVDLVSQQTTSSQATSTPTPAAALTASKLSTIVTSAATLLSPKSTTTLTMTLTAIDVRNTVLGVCCDAKVRWSYTQDGTLRPCGTPITGTNNTTVTTTQLPSQMLPVGTPLPQPISVLVSEVSYTYQPIMGLNLLPFHPVMQRSEYMLPRTVGQVITGPLPGSGAQYGQVCY